MHVMNIMHDPFSGVPVTCTPNIVRSKTTQRCVFVNTTQRGLTVNAVNLSTTTDRGNLASTYRTQVEQSTNVAVCKQWNMRRKFSIDD